MDIKHFTQPSVEVKQEAPVVGRMYLAKSDYKSTYDNEFVLIKGRSYRVQKCSELSDLKGKYSITVDCEPGSSHGGFGLDNHTFWNYFEEFNPSDKSEGKQEWEPENGEEVLVWWIEKDKYPATFITKDGDKYICRNPDGTYDGWIGISRADTTTYTRSEAEQKLTELVGKTVLIKD